MRVSIVLLILATSGCAVGVTATPDDDDNGFRQNSGGGGSGGEAGDNGSMGGEGGTSSAAQTTSATTATAGPATTAMTGGGSTCEAQVDCFACANCATANDCVAEADACLNDTDCGALIDCFNACVDDTCMNNCANQHPVGMNIYMVMTECAFCDACPTSCAVEGQGLCF